MNEQKSNYSSYQKANTKRGNSTQAGRDYINTNTTHMNFLISFFIIGVLALGGLAWALNVGLINKNPSNPTLKPQQSSSTSFLDTKL